MLKKECDGAWLHGAGGIGGGVGSSRWSGWNNSVRFGVVVKSQQYLLLNFSTLNPTVGTMLWYFSSAGLKWLRMVDLPELSKPTTRTLHSFFLSPNMLARRSKRPMIQYSCRSRTERIITGYNSYAFFFLEKTEYYKHSDVSFFFHYISRATLNSVPLSLTDKKGGGKGGKEA